MTINTASGPALKLCPGAVIVFDGAYSKVMSISQPELTKSRVEYFIDPQGESQETWICCILHK